MADTGHLENPLHDGLVFDILEKTKVYYTWINVKISAKSFDISPTPWVSRWLADGRRRASGFLTLIARCSLSLQYLGWQIIKETRIFNNKILFLLSYHRRISQMNYIAHKILRVLLDFTINKRYFIKYLWTRSTFRSFV